MFSIKPILQLSILLQLTAAFHLFVKKGRIELPSPVAYFDIEQTSMILILENGQRVEFEDNVEVASAIDLSGEDPLRFSKIIKRKLKDPSSNA